MGCQRKARLQCRHRYQKKSQVPKDGMHWYVQQWNGRRGYCRPVEERVPIWSLAQTKEVVVGNRFLGHWCHPRLCLHFFIVIRTWRKVLERVWFYHIMTLEWRLQWHELIQKLYWTTEENVPATTSWRKRNSTASVALLATAEVNQTKILRINQITDNSLCVHGSLSIRLNTSDARLPDESKGKARCSLHKWLGIETQKRITICKTCNANLCKSCFKLFHTEHDLVRMKKILKLKYSNNTRKNTNT